MTRPVILANGSFPKKGGSAWALLASSKRVVACDGAVGAYRHRFGRWPTAIVGDMDSVRVGHLVREIAWLKGAAAPDVVRFTDQDTNDLEKAIAYCIMRGWKTPVIVGATGRREDHTLGNIFRAFDCGCEIVTDTGRFVPICGKATLRVRKGAAISVFAPDPKTRMTSKGLAWPLDGVRFRNLFCATLNRATESSVSLTATRPVYIYWEDKTERKERK